MHVYKEVISKVVFFYEISTFDAFCVPVRLTYPIWKRFSNEILCVQFSFFLRLQFYFVNYVIVSCSLPNDNSLDQRMLLTHYK